VNKDSTPKRPTTPQDTTKAEREWEMTMREQAEERKL
jgi:hypothetical protein